MSNKEGPSLLEFMVREQLGLPVSNLVMDLLLEIHKEIPTNVNNINASYAQYLAGRFLKGMDLCADLYSIAVAYELKKETLKKREHGIALLNRARDQGLKTAKEKEAFANTDEVYLEACEVFADAKAFRVLVEMRRRDFEKAHYLMRKISEEDIEMSDPSPQKDSEENWNKFQTNNKRKSWSE
jgi:hypothetical protein